MSETVASTNSRMTSGLTQAWPKIEPPMPLFLGDDVGSVLFQAAGRLFLGSGRLRRFAVGETRASASLAATSPTAAKPPPDSKSAAGRSKCSSAR